MGGFARAPEDRPTPPEVVCHLKLDDASALHKEHVLTLDIV